MIVGTGHASEKLLIYIGFHAEPSVGLIDNVEKSKKKSRKRKFYESRVQWRMIRLIQDDRKSTVAKIATIYDGSIQNSIHENATRRDLKQFGYSTRRPCRL